MRRFLPLVLVFTLLLPAQSATAQSIVCQTINGPRSADQLTSELTAAGYGGPWDVSSLATAYGNAAGGLVNCGAGAGPAASGHRNAVMFVGGLNSSADSTSWSMLRQALADQHYAPSEMPVFSYLAGSTSYSPDQTCQSIEASRDVLTSWLRMARDRHLADSVYVVGHSLGGVVALEAAANAPDLKPSFLRGVIALDSPIEGIGKLGVGLFDGYNTTGYCEAAHQLFDRAQAGSSWTNQEKARISSLMQRGVQVYTFVNDADNLYSFDANTYSQTIPDLKIMVEGSWTDGGLTNHAAVLTTPDGVARIANIIASQGT